MKIPTLFFLNFDCNKILYSYNLYTCIIMIIEKKFLTILNIKIKPRTKESEMLYNL